MEVSVSTKEDGQFKEGWEGLEMCTCGIRNAQQSAAQQLATYLMQRTERVSTAPAASSEMRQLGLRPLRGETFERRPRLTSNPPAVGSCDALASWDVRSQSAAAPAPAAASGYSWSQNKTVRQLKSSTCKALDAWAFLKTGSLARLQRAQPGSVR